jgi:hypothetical protein
MASKRLKLLKREDGGGSVGDYPIFSMQRALARAGMEAVCNARSRPVQLAARVLARAALMRRVAELPSTAYFCPIMLLSEARLFPQCYFAETIVYCFDCWPALWDRWERFFRRHRMRLAFFSARQSAEQFRRRVPEMESVWLPEAVEAEAYSPGKPLERRSIDVLELGRRDEAYHEQITAPLAAAGRVHRYQAVPGQIIFPTREAMIAGFADAKVSVCFPSSMTHPARSGDVETATHRYFESMASRCILVGHGPAELVDLFGYNPVVQADKKDPAGQIEAIVSRPQDYAGLVDRNFARLMEVGTWDARVATLLEHLRERGYVL